MMRVKALLVCVALGLGTFFFTGCQVADARFDNSQVIALCELATLQCYYHNVAEMEYGANSLLRLNYKKIWIEYGGIVRIGVDVSKVVVSRPDGNGVVKVSMPKAKVLDIDLDESSIREVANTSLLAVITASDRVDALGAAQENMRESAGANEVLLLQGQARAKKVIEQYVSKIGAAIGRTYTIQWIDTDQQPAQSAPGA